MISDEKLNEFIKIYAREFGVWLSRKEAHKSASDLINLMKILVKPSDIIEGIND